MRTRRQFLTDTAMVSGAALLTAKAAEAAAQAAEPAAAPARAPSPGHAGHAGSHDGHLAREAAPTMMAPPRVLSLAATSSEGARMTTPNNVSLTGKLVNGVRVFHLIASGIEHEFTPGLRAKCWGYNGRTPGPTLEATQGERIRIYMENRLPEPTATHWHGVLLPNGMDGVAGLTQRYIQPGETFVYEFDLKHAGTFMYHPHLDEMTQMGMGLSGMFIVHPKKAKATVDRDFAIMLGEWHVPVGGSRPDPREMVDFNVLTLNGKAFPGTDALVVRTGQRVRIRYGNLSAMHNHPMHLHGYAFRVTATDGGPTPASAQHPETTVLVPVGSTRDIEFVADAPGDWAMHCHFTHHIMNQMGHKGPNMIGIRAEGLGQQVRGSVPGFMTMGQNGMAAMGEMKMSTPKNAVAMKGAPGKHGYIDMGGMFTVLKVRDGIESFEDPGAYENPAGTLAEVASAEAMLRDGITQT